MSLEFVHTLLIEKHFIFFFRAKKKMHKHEMLLKKTGAGEPPKELSPRTQKILSLSGDLFKKKYKSRWAPKRQPKAIPARPLGEFDQLGMNL